MSGYKLRDPDEQHYHNACLAMGRDPGDTTPGHPVLLSMASAWASLDANYKSREAAIVKTKLEEAALWFSRVASG